MTHPTRNEALREAAELTILHFKRNTVSGVFQGDDEHECWAALEAALAMSEPQPFPPNVELTDAERKAAWAEPRQEGTLFDAYRIFGVIAELRHVAAHELTKPLSVHLEALQICMEQQAQELEHILRDAAGQTAAPATASLSACLQKFLDACMELDAIGELDSRFPGELMDEAQAVLRSQPGDK